MVAVSTLREKTDVCDAVERSVSIFIEAVELSSELEIIGTSFPENADGSRGEEVFVMRDYTKAEGVDGAYVEVSIAEVVEKVTDFDRAQELLRVISNDRSSIVLNGITRIVGYYSRVNNWNKSKVGELRDRSSGSYGLTREKPCFQEERLKMIDSL
ncbi:MAG: anaerobic ribonucleoside-triphosphate reductase [Candidatus Scalindua sp.]|nr:anaerobic ribonucleoside-triphosphate reductase [Candidatus Scalindua sp.]